MSQTPLHPVGSAEAAGGVGRHFAGVPMNGPLTVSLVAVSLVVIAVAVGAFSVLASALTGSIHDGQPSEVISDLVAKHDQKSSDYAKRFDGRSIFYKPPPPAPKPRPVEDRPPPPPPPPVDNTPKVSPVYQGPSIAWVIGDDVYFNMTIPTATEKYMRVGVGEERNGVKVINTEKLPRTVRVAHGGGEYDVKVFGDGMNATALFPTTGKPSILIPGFIPAREPTSPADAAAAESTTEANAMQVPSPDADVATVSPATSATSNERPQRDGRSRSGRRPPRGDGGGSPQSADAPPADTPPADASQADGEPPADGGDELRPEAARPSSARPVSARPSPAR